MNKLIIGIVLGAIVGYCAKGMKRRGQFGEIGDELDKYTSKARKKLRYTVEAGKSQIEDLRNKAEHITK